MKIKKIIIFILPFIIILPLFACSVEPEEQITHSTSTELIKNLSGDDLKGIKTCEYETIRLAYKMFGKNFSMGPTDPSYRGIITLSEEEGENLFNQYNWLWDDTFVLQDIGEIDTSYLQGNKWYYCNDFNVKVFPTVIVNYIYFNGKDTIIFDVSSF